MKMLRVLHKNETNGIKHSLPQELITMMLLVDVDQRFSAVQVLEHPWVNVSDFLLSLHVLRMFFLKLHIS